MSEDEPKEPEAEAKPDVPVEKIILDCDKIAIRCELKPEGIIRIIGQ